MSSDICVVGSLNADRTIQLPRLPVAGETAVGHVSSWGPGGKGGNQAAAAASLGGRVRMIGCLGADTEGDWLRRDLADRGIDVSGIRTDTEQRTGAATIALDPEGGNLIIVDAGANWSLSAADVVTPWVRDARVVLAQLEVPALTVAAVVEHATGLVVLNPAPYRELPAQTLSRVDVLVPNLPEFASLCGLSDVPDLDGARGLLGSARLPGAVVVTMGELGALVRSAEDGAVVHVPTPSVEVVDTTGAGDCLCGALAVALAEGADVVEAAQFAVAAASCSTRGRGARGALPRRSDMAAVSAAPGAVAAEPR